MRDYCGNPGRSGHSMSLKMGEKIYETRRQVAQLFHIETPERILFTKNTTESLNLAMQGFLQEDDHVVTTSMEHNSVLRPLKALEQRGVRHTIVNGDASGIVSVQAIASAITDATRLIIMTGASNVTGTIMPIRDICKMAKEKGIYTLIDGAQCAGCLPMDVEEMEISMLAFPGHKGLLGPQGTACLYVSPDLDLIPLLYGGTGTSSKKTSQPLDYPEGFEAGTLNGPGLVGLGYSAKVVETIGIEAINFYEKELISYLEEYLQNMEFVTCYGPAEKDKTGISLFNIRGYSSEEVTDRLSREFGIAVRGGFHCAGLAHKTIGTWETGAVRLSVGPFNTRKEIRTAAEAIYQLGKRCV